MLTEPTNGELGRRLDVVADSVRVGFTELNLRFDRYVLGEVHDLTVGALARRIDEQDERLDRVEAHRVTTGRWWATTVISVTIAVVSALIAILIK